MFHTPAHKFTARPAAQLFAARLYHNGDVPMASAQLLQVLKFANTHDCGVTPTAVLSNDLQSVVIRVQAVHRDGRVDVVEETVTTIAEARVALGY